MNNSKPINNEVIGQFVTPQNTATIPTSAHRPTGNPNIVPNALPRVAPIIKEGMISPPLYPADNVIAVKRIFSKNA